MEETEIETPGSSHRDHVGTRLAEARKAQGLTIEDVAASTRVRPRHLELIEAGVSEGLPAPTYSAGFVKTYAQMLGLDGAAMARDFRAEMIGAGATRIYTEPFEPADPKRVPTRLLAVVGLIVAALLALGYMFWRGGGLTADERAQIAAGTPEASVKAPATVAAKAPVASAAEPLAPPPVPVAGPVILTATGPVWIKIYEKGGPTLHMAALNPGERYEVPATAIEPLLWTGRPEAIRVTVGGTPIPQLGKPDERIRDVSLAPAALLARLPRPASPAPAAAPEIAAPAVTPVDPAPVRQP